MIIYSNLKYNLQNPQIFAKKVKIYPKVAFSTVVAKSRAEEVIRNTTLPFCFNSNNHCFTPSLQGCKYFSGFLLSGGKKYPISSTNIIYQLLII